MTDRNQGSKPRKTVFIVAAVLAAMAAWSLFHRHRIIAAEIEASITAALLVIGLFFPSAASSFHRAWMRLAAVLGHVNTTILLSAVFFLLLFPVGLVMKAFRRDRLRRRSPRGESFWVPREASRQTKEGFERAY